MNQAQGVMDWAAMSLPPATGFAERLLGPAPRVTTYSPQRGGDRMEGGYASSRPGPDGQAMVRTLEDFRTGQAPYVTIAGNPSLYGREYTIPEVTYQAGGQRHVLRDVPVVVHDTGAAFHNAPEGRFDVPVGRDMSPADTNQGLSGVQFMPRQAMAYSDQQMLPPGAQAMQGARRPVPGSDPIPSQPTAAQIGQDTRLPWEMDWPDAAPQQQAGPMPWEMDWPDATPSAPSAPSGLLNNLTAGANDMIYSTLGAPVDAATWAVNKGVQGINAATGAELPQARPNLPGSSRWLAGVGKALGVNDPASVTANTTEDRLARAAGAGMAGILAPEAALAGLNRAGIVSEGAMNALAPIFGRSASGSDLAVNAGVGAAAGVGGQMVGDVLPEAYRPLGETVGNLLGGAVGVGAVGAGRAAAEAPQAWRNFRLSKPAAQEAAAGSVLRNASSNPHGLMDALDAAPRQIVPGSNPTTFQATGDMGLGHLERAYDTRSPTPFLERRAEQNAARVGALEGIQPGGAPEQVVQVLRQSLSELDRQTARALDEATATARTASDALGGTGAPEMYGADIRSAVMAARDAAKAGERALWRAVDPDDSLNLPATGTRDSARRIVSDLPRLAEPMSGAEAAIFGDVVRLPDVIPFRELTALRSRVSTALTEELSTRGASPVYARLSQLRGAIERDIENAVAAKADMEQRAVQAGVMSEEDTLASKLWRETNEWRTKQAEAEARRGDAAGAGEFGTAPSTSFSAGARSSGEARGRPGSTQGDQGLQSPGSGIPSDLIPNLDEGAAGRLKAASAATKQRAETFDQGRVGAVARRSGAQGPFHMEAAAVPGRFFVPGPRGAAAIEALRAAAPEALDYVRSYAIGTLRRAAESPVDGVLIPDRVQAWRRKYADALRAMPELDRMLADPVQAAETMARLAAGRKSQLDAFQKDAIGRLLNLDNPGDVVNTVGAIFGRQDSARQMAMLKREAMKDPQAMGGLRRAVADYITLRFVGNTEGATSGQNMMRSDSFQNFLKRNQHALRWVLSEPEVNLLGAIARDLHRSNRSVTSAKLPGRSNTAQDLHGAAGAGPAESWLSRLLTPGALGGAAAAAGGTLGGLMGGGLGAGMGGAAGGALGSHFGRVAQAMRQAGLQRVDEIVTDALLNPDRARALLARTSAVPTPREALNLARVYLRASLLPGSDGAPQPAGPALPGPASAPAPAAAGGMADQPMGW